MTITTRKARHGASRPGSPDFALYGVWITMRARTRKHPRYAGRGIKVCQRWQSFAVFRRWALSHGYAPGLSIDRIDNNGPYSPGNCRWATPRQQARNTHKTMWITAWGERKALLDWVDDVRCMVCRSTLEQRLRMHWPVELAIVTPPLPPALRGRGRPPVTVVS